MTEERHPLPQRRPNHSLEFEFESLRYQLTVGFYGDGRIGEVWLNGPRSDSALYHITQDACILISHLLQRFVSPEMIEASLPRKPDGGSASIIGAIILELIAMGASQ
jgi:hypothetical protein